MNAGLPPEQQKFATDLLFALKHPQHITTFQWIFLWSSILLPLPFTWKLSIFNFFYRHNINVSVIIAYTIIFVVLAVLIALVIYFLPKILRIVYYNNQRYALLSVKPPHNATQSTFSTTQLFTIIHSIGRQISWWDAFIGRKKLISCELVSTKEQGIRYIIRVPVEFTDIIQKNLYAYLPGVEMEEINDYLPSKFSELKEKSMGIIELKLATHFLLPLQSHTALSEHDPIAFITAHMTKLSADDLTAIQVILTPVMQDTHKKIAKEIERMSILIHNGFDITHQLNKYQSGYLSFLFGFVRFVIYLAIFIMFTPLSILASFLSRGAWPFLPTYIFFHPKPKKNAELSKRQQELQQIVREKMNEELFEVSVRICLISSKSQGLYARASGLVSSLSVFQNGSYQDFEIKNKIPVLHRLPFFRKLSFLQYRYRLLSLTKTIVLSVSEVSSLYHFPYTSTTKTEDLAKVISPELPTPLILKNANNLNVVFGKNTYGNSDVEIGLTDDERSRHMYLIGQTGSGKSTILFHMAKDDIQKGRGLCVIDPHGDLVEDLLITIPKNRINDVVYINPFDIKHPIGINLLELTSGLDEDEQELEKELVTESVITIFRRIFSKEENVDAHRIEYILRNTIHTAFYVKNVTIFTIYELLTDQDFRNKAIANIEDKHLQNFWKNEFGKAGDYQVVKMISGVTAKVGRFLFSPIARRILEQTHSTVRFDELLDEGKIILCNLSEGKLGEDTAQLLGTTIITKIHQAILKRARMDKALRKPFYLYVDEFQTFATISFTKLLSGGRKYGLRITIAEQSTTQQADNRIVNVILANVGTIVSFRTASPVDEELMLSQFNPLVTKGNILNLPRFHFYIKLGAKEPQEPFSGETFPIEIKKDIKKLQTIIASSQKNYAREYVKPKPLKVRKKQKKDVEKEQGIDAVLV